MLFGLLSYLRKIAIGILVVLSMGCLVAVFSARLPNQEVCINLMYWHGNVSERIYDLTNGRFTIETRATHALTTINSPDGKKSILLRPVRHETDLYDLYLQAGDLQTRPRLLQRAVQYASGNTQLLGDQLRWSRDSNRVAFLWNNSDQDFHLTVVKVDDDQMKTITPFAKDPSKTFYTRLQEWSADDRYISVIEQVLNDTRYTFWDTDTLTSVPYSLSATSMVHGVWSPQGQLFAAILQDDHHKPASLIILNPDHSDTVVQTPLPPVNIQHLMWSPDGKSLVIGYLTCKEVNCHQQWHYALFQSDGTPMASDLVGSTVNSTNIAGNTIYGPDGRTAFSGYPFNASWSNDGKRFIYLEQSSDSNSPTYGVGVFDIDKQQGMTLATYPTVNFNNSFFHTVQYTNLSSRILELIPTLPLTDQMIIPYSDNGKISVALNGGSLQKSIILVEGADQLISLPDPQFEGQYWRTDGYGNDHILIEWSTGEGKDKRLKLTTADGNGNNIRTVDEDLDDISNAHFVYDVEHPLLGFIGKKGEQYNLYILDLNTSKQTLLLENVEDNGDWEVSFNSQNTLMAIRGSIIYPGGGQLYIRSAKNDTLIKVNADSRSITVWSGDGEKIALIAGHNNGTQDLLIVGKDGKPITRYEVSQNSSETIFPVRWSKCY